MTDFDPSNDEGLGDPPRPDLAAELPTTTGTQPLRRRLLIGLIALVATLIGVELGLRAWYPVGRTIYRRDKELLHATIPGASRIQPMPAWAGGARNRVELGPQGYRGPALEQPKRRPRLAVVGDSLVMAENVAYADSFPARLSAHLNDEYEVVSVGASGYGPDQTLLRLVREWTVLDPDVVLLVLCANNDCGDVVRNKLFSLERGGRLRRGRPVLGPDAAAHLARSWKRSEDLALVRLVRSFREARARGEQQAREEREPPVDYMQLYLDAGAREWSDQGTGGAVVHDLFRDYYDADLALTPDSESAQGKRALMGALMELWAQKMEERHTPLRVLILPSAVDLDPDFRIQVDPERWPGYDPRAQTQVLRAAAARAAAPTHDLFDLFEQGDPAELFVGYDDIHWNERGIELAAADVARWLSELARD